MTFVRRCRNADVFLMMLGSPHPGGDFSVASFFGAPCSDTRFCRAYLELVYKDRRQAFETTIFSTEIKAVAAVAEMSVDHPTDGGSLAPPSEASPSNVGDASNMVIIGHAFPCDNSGRR